MLSLLIFTVVVLLIGYLVSFFREPSNYPPGPTRYPFVGNILEVKKLSEALGSKHLALQKLSEMYNTNVLGLKSGRENIVVVFSYPTVKSVFTREEFEGRPNNFFAYLRNMGLRKGITLTDGKLWQIQRKFVMTHLRNLGFGKQPMEKLIRDEVKDLLFTIQENENKEIKVDNTLSVSVLNVMWSFTSGNRLLQNDVFPKRILDLLTERTHVLDVAGGTLNHFPWLRFIAPEKSGYNLIQRINADLKAIVMKTIREHFSTWTEGRNDDLIYAFITEMNKDSDPETTYTEDQLLMMTLDMFMAGSQITNHMLDFTFYAMILYPDVQEKVRSCINEAFGKHEELSYFERNRVPYVEAVLCEIERFYHVMPISGPRRALRNTVLEQYTIPKDTTILISLYSLNYDKDYWMDPEVFRPERFLDSDGKLIYHEQFIPFGIGRRKCLCDILARNAIFIFFTEILRIYKIIQYPGSPKLTGKIQTGITLTPEKYTATFIKQ